MRLLRSFVDQPVAVGMRFALPESAHAHLVKVLRLDAGSPFERLSEKQRVRLIVRILCELVAYDEIDDVEIDETLSA